MPYKKYYIYKEQVSYDFGMHWEDTGNRAPSGDPIGTYSTLAECEGTTPIYDGKCKLTYSHGGILEVECNNSSTLTSGETHSGPSLYANMTSAVIGGCVTSIGNDAFRDCSSLSSIVIPDSVTSIGGTAFAFCSSLSSIVIPDTVTSIGGSAFYECGISSIEIPNGITYINNYTFASSSLTSITIPNTVTRIDVGAFSRCGSLASISLPNGLTYIGAGAFENCISLTELVIPSSVVDIREGSFSDCSGLTSITVNATTPPSLLSGAFLGTNNCPIYVPCESVETYKNTEGWSTYAPRINGIPPCDPPPTPTFDGKFKLTYSGGRVVSGECSSNTTLTSGDTNPSGYQSSAMTSAEIGDCVTAIGTIAFRYCSGLTSVVIGSGVTTIGETAFGYCNALGDIPIPDSVTEIGYGAFYYCSGLTSVIIPNNVTNIGKMAFQYCSYLTSITIGSGVTSIGAWAFESCRRLTSITVNATTPPSLGSHAFDGTNNCPIYVPSQSVSAYKSAKNWSNYASRIQAIP